MLKLQPPLMVQAQTHYLTLLRIWRGNILRSWGMKRWRQWLMLVLQIVHFELWPSLWARFCLFQPSSWYLSPLSSFQRQYSEGRIWVRLISQWRQEVWHWTLGQAKGCRNWTSPLPKARTSEQTQGKSQAFGRSRWHVIPHLAVDSQSQYLNTSHYVVEVTS